MNRGLTVWAEALCRFTLGGRLQNFGHGRQLAGSVHDFGLGSVEDRTMDS